MSNSHRRSASKHSKLKTHRRQTQHRILRGLLLVLAVLMLCFGLFLWKAALELNAPAEPTVLAAEDDFRPVVGDPPYRVAIDAGHGGSDPGARGAVEEKQVTAATAAALLQWLEEDSNYIPLQTREGFDATATPAQRAAAASAQSPQLLLSIHGNSAANGSTAAGFECYPAVPGRTWHQESFYCARLLAGGMQSIGAKLRGRGGVRYIYYLENDQKQLVENTYTQVRPERSFTLLEDVDCPAVLAEQCFVTNTEDVKRFGSEEGCKAVARIYYEAICAYFGTEPLPVK